MTNSKLQMALQEAATLEFSGIPTHEGDITYNFSDDFLRKMDVLTKSERRVFWRISNTARKRVALVFLVVLLLGLAACSIPAVREKLAGFIVTIFDSHATVSNEGHGTNEITERYVITEVPEGFVQVDVGETSSFIVTTYCHPDGSKIIFSQSVGSETLILTR